MSKSSPDPNSRILLTDPQSIIQSKIKKSVTDSTKELSFSPIERPGISNLLLILSSLSSSNETPEEIASRLNEEFGGGSKVLKEVLTERIEEELKPIREKIEMLKKDRGYLEELEKKGRDKAREKASVNLDQVKRLVGLKK